MQWLQIQWLEEKLNYRIAKYFEIMSDLTLDILDQVLLDQKVQANNFELKP